MIEYITENISINDNFDIQQNGIKINLFDEFDDESYQNEDNLKFESKSVNFFNKDEDENSNEKSVCKSSSIELSVSFNKNTALNGLLIYDDIKDEYNLRKKAIDNLQKSFENFFVLLQMLEEKSNLESLTLEIDKPFNLIDKSLYWILLKLFFNLLLEFNRELLNLKVFNFIIPYFNLDNSYYSFIETFFNGINLNFKNKSMTHFHFQAQITNIPNFSNLISYNLTIISIGDLDYISLKSLVKTLL